MKSSVHSEWRVRKRQQEDKNIMRRVEKTKYYSGKSLPKNLVNFARSACIIIRNHFKTITAYPPHPRISHTTFSHFSLFSHRHVIWVRSWMLGCAHYAVGVYPSAFIWRSSTKKDVQLCERLKKSESHRWRRKWLFTSETCILRERQDWKYERRVKYWRLSLLQIAEIEGRLEDAFFSGFSSFFSFFNLCVLFFTAVISYIIFITRSLQASSPLKDRK